MIEFALAFPIMALLFTGVFEWGYTFYMYNSLLTNVRAGARFAAQKAYIPSTTSTSNNPTAGSCFATPVKNLVVYGTPTPGNNAQPLVPGLATSNIDVRPIVDAAGTPISMRVSISSTQPFTLGAVIARHSLAGKPSVTFPYTGIYSPGEPCQ
jgi:Flp pilus assembly protein TadG